MNRIIVLGAVAIPGIFAITSLASGASMGTESTATFKATLVPMFGSERS